MATFYEYLVCRQPTGEIIAVCDTMKEARQAVARLQAHDVKAGTYEPYTYKIQGVREIEGDCEGQAVCWHEAVDLLGGLVP